jgi:peptidyl-prolyl cis-trans isomerase C
MDVAVNGRRISEDLINREMQYHPAPSREAARQQALRALVIRELLLQNAQRLGLEPSPEPDETEDEACIRRLIEREVRVAEPDEQSCRRFFDKNRAQLRSPRLHTVSHILFMAPEEPLARQDADGKARALIAELQGDAGRFAELAALHSDCPSRDQGGHMGVLRPGQAVPEFERALDRLTPGEIAPAPIESRYGFHVVFLHSRDGGQPYTFAEARPLVAAYLRESMYRRAVLEFVQRLAAESRIDGFAMPDVQTSLA